MKSSDMYEVMESTRKEVIDNIKELPILGKAVDLVLLKIEDNAMNGISYTKVKLKNLVRDLYEADREETRKLRSIHSKEPFVQTSSKQEDKFGISIFIDEDSLTLQVLFQLVREELIDLGYSAFTEDDWNPRDIYTTLGIMVKK